MKNSILSLCQRRLAKIKFVDSGSFYWSPKTKTIHFNNATLDTSGGQWALLHEAAHASLKHQSYANDMGLLELEVEAWQKAAELGRKFDIIIDPDHMQECLDTYRDWLYARSTCPTCELNSLQIEETVYLCLNCSTRWIVSHSRFCRPYRMSAISKQRLENSEQKTLTDIAFR